MPPITNAADSAGVSASRRAVRIAGMVYRSSVACKVQLWLTFFAFLSSVLLASVL